MRAGAFVIRMEAKIGCIARSVLSRRAPSHPVGAR
jgi:hypothetical protein